MESKGRTLKSIKNIFYGLLGQVVVLALNFVSRKIFINILGMEYQGINGLFSNVLSMLSLADLGLGSAMVFSYYKPLAEQNKEKLRQLNNFYKKIYNYIAVAVLAVGLMLIPFLKYLINLEKDIPHIYLYYILFLLNSVISYLFVYKSAILNADQKSYIISICAIRINIINIIAQTIVLLLTRNYILYLILMILATLANNFYVAYQAKKIYPYLDEKDTLPKEEQETIVTNIKAVFLYKLSSVLLNGTDNIIISKLVGTVWVGSYSNYNMLINAVNNFIGTAFGALNASVGNLIVEKKEKDRYEVFKILLLVSFWIALFSTNAFAILINDFIKLWIGNQYVLSDSTIIAILINFYLGNVSRPIWCYREATGLYYKTRFVMLVTAGINIVLSIILGIKFGVAGIIFASGISRIVTYVWYEPIILFKEYFNKSTKEYFIDQIKNALFTIVVIIISFLLVQRLEEVNIVNFIIKIAICVLVPNILFVIFNYKKEEFKLIRKRIKIKK